MRAWKNFGQITSVETVQNPMFEPASVAPGGRVWDFARFHSE